VLRRIVQILVSQRNALLLKYRLTSILDHPDGFETSSDNESGSSHVNLQSPKSARNHDDVQDRVAFMSQKLAPIFQEMVSQCLSSMIRDMVLQLLAPKLQSMLEQHLPSILIEYETMGQACKYYSD
jgi:hypothetical protein